MVKALFCGDIEGHLQEAVERVRKVNGSKAGPFDVLFCIGRFLDENNSIPQSADIEFPIPTYVVLKDETLSSELKEHFASVANVTVVTDVDYIQFQDLNVLCIPGVYDAEHYLDEANTSSAYYRKSQIDRILSTIPQTGVDFVLSAEWSYGMLHHLDSTRFPTIPNCTTVGSPIISTILKIVCPRYHFAGSLNTFYERLPYRNPDDTISRIVCLGPVKAGSDKSRKWIHALNVTPRSQMKREDLCSIDVSFTPSPFETRKRDRNESEDRQKRMRTQDETPNYRFDLQRNSTCWFCLAAPNVEKQLIVCVSEGAYLAVPKGQLCLNHLLVIPVVHRQSSLQLPPEAIEDVERFKRALVKMFQDQGKAVLLWERNLTTRNPVHCHIQILPIDASKVPVVKLVLDAAATQRGFRFSDIPDNQSLREFAGEDDFLYCEVYGVGEDQPKRMGYVVRERRPNMQFFHQAVGSLLEAENVGEDWKSLQKSPEEEAKIAEKVRELFKPYDFTLTGKEHDEEDFKYCPPKKEGLFSVMQSLSPILGSNFLLFDSNGLEYVASGISEPIPTGIPSFVPYLDARTTLELIGQAGTAKSMIAYIILAHVVAPRSVGGLESPVVIFDLDRKLDLGNLVKSISLLLLSIEVSEERSKSLLQSVERILVYQPVDLLHFCLLVHSMCSHTENSPRLILLDSLSAFLFDIADPIASYSSSFQLAMKALSKFIQEKKASLILVSPEHLRKSSSYYYPPKAWSIPLDHRLYCSRILEEEPEDPSCSKFRVTDLSNRDKRSVFYMSNVDLRFSSE